MPENIEMIKQLLDYVKSYRIEVGNSDLKEFSIYLKDKLICHHDDSDEIEFEKSDFQNYKKYAEVEFSTLLTELYRFAKHYTKKAFKEKHNSPACA